MATRKYVQFSKDKEGWFVTLVGDESLGMSPIEIDGIWCFNIENHPQKEEIVEYMRYDEEKDKFYWPGLEGL